MVQVNERLKPDDKLHSMKLPKQVEVVGPLPIATNTLFVLCSSTPTERAILNDYFKDQFKGGGAHTAWVTDEGGGDNLNHKGLTPGLDAPNTLNIVPVGIAWKPKSAAQQKWREIASWMRLIDSNWRQKLVWKHTPERCAIVIGESGSRKVLEDKFRRFSSRDPAGKDLNMERFANFVALQAALTVERDGRQATGQTIKYPRFVIRSIWGRRDFQEQLQEIADETGETLEAVQDDARKCLAELVPKVRAPHVSFSTAFARKVCRLGYEDEISYDSEKMQEVRELALTRPTALVWTHKTHIDGFAIMLASREENFPLIHTIGGNNMAFLGIGYLMRRVGTVFIRRSIDSPVYKAVLRNYLSYLLEKRFPISWALEGTRSRNGKLMPPRFGILKYVVEAAAKENTKNLTVIPVSIYYDLIAELGDYAREQTGAKKRKESLAWFLDYLRSLRKPLGRISMGLGEPVIVDTTTDRFAAAIGGDNKQFSVELQKLAFEASVSVNAATPITPSSLISLALTGAAPQALLRQELAADVVSLIEWANERGLPMTDELVDFDRPHVRTILESMIEIGVVSAFDDGPQTVFSIAEGKHFEASYYRNNAIHMYVTKALIEVALAKASEVDGGEALQVFWDEVVQLRDVFKFEFFYPDLDAHRLEIAEELERYDKNWPARLAKGGAGKFLAEMTPLVSHAVLRPFAEAYSVVADVLKTMPEGEMPDQKEVVNSALKLGKQAFLQRRITSEESIGKLMFSNGCKLAANRHVGKDVNAARDFLREMNDITRRLRYIGGIANDDRAKRIEDV